VEDNKAETQLTTLARGKLIFFFFFFSFIRLIFYIYVIMTIKS